MIYAFKALCKIYDTEYMDIPQFQCVASATRAFYTCSREHRATSNIYKIPCDAVAHHVYVACMQPQNKNVPQEKNGRN
jgi:hypothetical protein